MVTVCVRLPISVPAGLLIMVTFAKNKKLLMVVTCQHFLRIFPRAGAPFGEMATTKLLAENPSTFPETVYTISPTNARDPSMSK